MERGAFVAEGHMQLGPTEYYFVFLDGEYLGKLVSEHFGIPEERGYTDIGWVRVTVEMLKASQT
jgi:hypothetical protein